MQPLSKIYRGVPSGKGGWFDSFDTAADWNPTYWTFYKTPAATLLTHLINNKLGILNHTNDANGNYQGGMTFLPITNVNNISAAIQGIPPSGSVNQSGLFMINRSPDASNFQNNYAWVWSFAGSNMTISAQRNLAGVNSILAIAVLATTTLILTIEIYGGNIHFSAPQSALRDVFQAWVFPTFDAYVQLGINGVQGDLSNVAFDNFILSPSNRTLIS